MRMLKLIFVSLLMIFNVSLYAITVDEAKDQGLVIEKKDGYLEAKIERVDIEDLVKTTNKKRKIIYKQIAKKRNVPLKQIEESAGKKNTTPKK